jgi:polysaccharide deacetylase 2 family uncharacterized protein YibQ
LQAGLFLIRSGCENKAMIDDLDRPLGIEPEPTPKVGRSRLWLGAGVALALAGAAIAVTQLGGSGAPGGEPEAVAPIQPLPARTAPPPPAPPPSAAQADGVATAQQVESESGVKVFRGGAAAPSAVIIQVPEAATTRPLAPAPDRRLVEKSRYGLLPRRGKDGASPSDVYARPLAMQLPIKPGTPRIAILVGGMGLNPAATDEAIQKLPPGVSLAFAPYGEQAERQASAAREAGHEILLQTPMEPFDAADSPGPHVLLAADSDKAAEDLHWQMGRFSGYVGLVNFLGGRFTADRPATQAFMRELSERGLDYVDDGSSPQSLAAEIAGEKGVGFVKADLRLDESKRPEAVDAALFRLETLARQKGMAVGFAAGLPAANERIARFAAELGRRGVALIPVSAAIRAQNDSQSEKR